MSISDVEIDVAGTKLRGVWVAIVVSLATSIGGGLWAVSEFFFRIDSLESNVDAIRIPDLSPLSDRVGLVEQRLDDQGVAGLQAKLAELGTSLESIMERQQELLDMRDRISEGERTISELSIEVENRLEKMDEIVEDYDRVTREQDDLWEAMDYLSNPLQ